MMKRGLTLLVAGGLFWGVVALPAHAQKGMGEQTGVGRQAAKPEVISLSGKVLAIETGPCKTTTGRADVGSHLLLKTPKGKELNVHLGPTAAVGYIIAQLPVGKKVTVHAFRTTKMPKNHYAAQSLTFGSTTIRLRDASLRPFWAGGGAVSRGLAGSQWARGKGRGFRYGPGWGGPGRGYGRGGPGGWYGRGLRRRGPGYGRGPGSAARRGAAFGRR